MFVLKFPLKLTRSWSQIQIILDSTTEKAEQAGIIVMDRLTYHTAAF